MEGQEYVYSDTFGVITPRARQGNHNVQISKLTQDYPEVTELIVKWAMHEYEVMRTFPFTTFTINGGLKTKMHRGANNAGARL